MPLLYLLPKSLELGLLMYRLTDTTFSQYKDDLVKLFNHNIQLATFDLNCVVRAYAQLVGHMRDKPSIKVMKVDKNANVEDPLAGLKYKTGYLSNIVSFRLKFLYKPTLKRLEERFLDTNPCQQKMKLRSNQQPIFEKNLLKSIANEGKTRRKLKRRSRKLKQ